MTFTELAAVTGLAKSTTSRMLLALERNGLIRREATGAFRPGDAFVRYALRGNADTISLASPTPSSNGWASTPRDDQSRRDPHQSMVEQIAQVDSHYVLGRNKLARALRAAALHRVGKGAPCSRNCQASSPGAWRASPRRRSRGDPCSKLNLPRHAGVDGRVTDEELEPGLVAVAAPVYRSGGAAIAAISVSGPSTRLHCARMTEVAAQCMAEANALSGVLGYRPQREGAA